MGGEGFFFEIVETLDLFFFYIHKIQHYIISHYTKGNVTPCTTGSRCSFRQNNTQTAGHISFALVDLKFGTPALTLLHSSDGLDSSLSLLEAAEKKSSLLGSVSMQKKQITMRWGFQILF